MQFEKPNFMAEIASVKDNLILLAQFISQEENFAMKRKKIQLKSQATKILLKIF